MKTLIFAFLLIISTACQARGIKNGAEKTTESRDLAQDIMFAKSNMTMLTGFAEQMGGAEMNTLLYLNEYAQHDIFVLYETLLKFKINEEEIKKVSNLTDTQILELSREMIKANIDPRVIRTDTGLAWHDLHTEILDPLSERKISIENTVTRVSQNVMDIEDLLKTLKTDVKIAVDDLTTGLNEEQLAEVTFLLDNMNGMVNSQIEILRFTRTQLVDITIPAMESLQKVIDQQQEK